MSLIEFINANISAEFGELVMAVMLAIIFIVVHDFYHALHTAVFSWFKK